MTPVRRRSFLERITPTGGGYCFAVPGVRNAHDYYASGLLAG
jgi:deferrochelatase/peroxidase EfeB